MLGLAVLWAGSCYDLPLICLVGVLFWMSGGLVWFGCLFSWAFGLDVL